MNKQRALLLALAAAAIVAFFMLDLQHALSFTTIKARQAEFIAFREQHPVWAVLGFLLAYALSGTLPLPGAAIITVLAGALFGVVGGLLVASVTGAIGATIGFALSRYLLRGWLSRRYATQVRRIDEGLARDGTLYLFTLRLLPVLPFFLINLSFGVSAMRLRSFWLISQLGMAPGALVFANAGSQLSQLDNLHGILSPALLGSFALLALFPWIARALLRLVRTNRSAS